MSTLEYPEKRLLELITEHHPTGWFSPYQIRSLLEGIERRTITVQPTLVGLHHLGYLDASQTQGTLHFRLRSHQEII